MLNVLKCLVHPHTGCKRNRLIPLYQTLIRSILDYGFPIYSLASKSQLALLEPIQKSAIRICTGAFRRSPHLSLWSDPAMPPLHYRGLFLPATLISSILCLPNTHVHQLLFNTQLNHDTYCRAHTPLPNFYKSLSIKKFALTAFNLSSLPPLHGSPSNQLLTFN